MRKRHRKPRAGAGKTGGSGSGSGSPVKASNKENCCASIICDFRQVSKLKIVKTPEPPPSSQPSASQMRKKSESHWKRFKRCKSAKKSSAATYEQTFFELKRLSNIQSIAFFIPLQDCIYNFDDATIFAQMMNDLLFIECQRPVCNSSWCQIERESHRWHGGGKCGEEAEMAKRNFKKNRSVSESSVNSEDSFICFDINDSLTKEDTDTVDVAPRYNCDSINYLSNVRSKSAAAAAATPGDTKKSKRVRFAGTDTLVTVHQIIAWDYAYRAARISPWETVARDSTRFKQKVQSLERVLSPVLSPEHRSKIWQNRMVKYYE